MVRIGVDTGGTFTDFIYATPDGGGTYKTLSTPDNPSEAILHGIRHLLAETGTRSGPAIVHGSTVATNAILERKGVPTCLVTNQGFTDVIEIGRQNRTRLYDLTYAKEPHIVPQAMRFGIPGRVTSEGEEATPFDEQAAQAVAQAVRDAGAQSAAVCLLFAFLHPDHEKRMGELLAAQGIPVSLSHEILAEFREFERTSTTVINAYVSPIMTRYLTDLKAATQGSALRIMQSNGGSISADTAMRESVRTILSGPAGGAVGAMEIGRTAGIDRIITFDMGGTSTDVSLMDGVLPMTMESSIAGYPVKVPMIDIHTVGAGGGSIATVDDGGALTVGPESAGAAPGPLCYGRGGTGITVTDANLFLGRIVPDHFLGGGMSLDLEGTERAMRAMAAPLGMAPEELAQGILDVANTNMERAIRVISVEKGFDPREFTLFSFGGAGGMHCADLARLLGMQHGFIPVNPGILSARGMLMADVVKDYSRTVMLDSRDMAASALDDLFHDLETSGMREMLDEGVPPERVRHERYLDMRYTGQSFEIIVPLDTDPVERFHAMHEKQYGHRNTGKAVEVVNIRLRTRGSQERQKSAKPKPGTATPDARAELGERNARFNGAGCKAKVLDRNHLKPGNTFVGPAIVVEYTSTIVVPPQCEVTVDAWGNLRLNLS